MQDHLFIIGAQRCGTTTLWNYLRACPQLCAAIPKENIYSKFYEDKICLYGKAGQPIKETKFFSIFYNGKNLNDYESYFDQDKIGFEASVEYFHFDYVPSKIKEAFGNKARFICLLRNPSDRAWSHYWHEINYNHSENLPFMKAIKAKIESIEDLYFKSYLKIGHYAEHLTRWFKIFNRENFLIIKSEDFFLNPEFWFIEIQKFLGLEFFTCLNKYPNISFTSKHPKMSGKTRKYLDDYFRPHNEKLYDIL